MANSQSRALRIISKANGWDPDKIVGQGSLPDGPETLSMDLSTYNPDRTVYRGAGINPLPGGSPERQRMHDAANHDPLTPKVTWDNDLPEHTNKARITSGANPNEGKPM